MLDSIIHMIVRKITSHVFALIVMNICCWIFHRERGMTNIKMVIKASWWQLLNESIVLESLHTLYFPSVVSWHKTVRLSSSERNINVVVTWLGSFERLGISHNQGAWLLSSRSTQANLVVLSLYWSSKWDSH